MPELPYSGGTHGGVDDSDGDSLYAAHAGLGLGDSSYVPGGMGQEHHHEQQPVQPLQLQQQQRTPDEEEEVILSPSDGYFGRSGSASDDLEFSIDPSHGFMARFPLDDEGEEYDEEEEASASGHVHPHMPSSASLPASSRGPHVPNVWVSDPSLEQGSTAEGKAREAREERAANRRLSAAAEEQEDHRRPNNYSSPNPAALGQTHQRYHHHHPPSTSTLSSPAWASRRSSSPFSSPSNPHTLQTNHQQHQQHTSIPRTWTAARAGSGYPTTAASGTSASASTTTAPPYRGHRYAPTSSSSASLAGPSYITTPLLSRPRRSDTAYSERSSLFSEAPPAYTPSPTSPTSTSSPYQYQSITPIGSNYTNSHRSLPASHYGGNMGRLSESESHGLLAGQTYQSIPESMVGEAAADDDGHFTYPQPQGWKDRIKNFEMKKRWKVALLALVLTFVTVGFLVSSMTGLRKQKTILLPGDGSGSAPVVSPPPPQGDDGTRLAYPVYDRYPTLAASTMCGTKEINYNPVTFSVDYSASRNLSIFQDIQQEGVPNGQNVRVMGDIVLRRSGAGTPEPSIVVETTSNDDQMAISLDWDDKEQRLNMLTPLSVAWTEAGSSPCVQVRVTMWAAPGSELDSLNVQSVHLGVQLLDNLSLRLNNFARLASTVGPINSAADGERDPARLMHEAPPSSYQLDTRFIEVKTMSAPVSGSWPLYDYLGLETISGTVRAGVQPKPALKDKPLPAILYAHSTSGDVEVREPVGDALAMWAAQQAGVQTGAVLGAAAEDIVPPREYLVDLYSMSGALRATLAFGTSCKAHTTSGHVDLTLLPVLDSAQADLAAAANPSARTSLLSTSSTSGTTSVTVLDAMWTDLKASTFVPGPSSAISPPMRRDPAPKPMPVGDSDPYDMIRPPARRSEIIQLTPPPQAAPPPPPPPASPLPTGSSAVAAAPAAVAAAPPPPALRILTGRHTATSASIHVSYPPSWEGFIDADSLSGRIEVGGQGVQIVKRESGLPGMKRHVLARKGDADVAAGTIKVHTTSGRVGVQIRS